MKADLELFNKLGTEGVIRGDSIVHLAFRKFYCQDTSHIFEYAKTFEFNTAG